ncbi:MAG: S9 family peptidase [Proteobacteria bacterium]|nr:S9 family peptidase [Pseudomonadota bacterium]
MPLRICAGAVIAAALFITPSYALPPVEAFGNLPFIAQARLSPDGKHFAAIQDLDGKPAAVIYTVGAGGPPQVFGSSNWLISTVDWLKNDRLMIRTKTGSHIPLGRNPDLYTWYRALTVEVGTNNWTQLFDRNNDSVGINTSTGVVVDRMPDDANYVLMPLWTRPKNDRIDNDVTAAVMGGSTADYRYSLYRVDVRTGHAVVIEDGTQYGEQWITDGAGALVGRVDITVTPLTDHVYLYNDGHWGNPRDFDAEGDRGASIIALNPDGSDLVRWRERGRTELALLDRLSGADDGVLYANPTYDVSEVIRDEWTGRVIGAAYIDDRPEFVYFDKDRQTLQSDIDKAFPGQIAHAVSLTRDGRTAIVEAEAPTMPPAYYYLDRSTDRATPIASEYPGLTSADLGEMRPYDYEARDGAKIHGFLTTPPGRKDAKGLPLVVMPHGGPDARDAIGFDWWAQFLANRGYAVFQPNYRGSTGYGRAYQAAGFQQWGLRMQDDITDGVKALIADGTANAKRICIVGASYGGYAALAGATFTPDLYACAVSFAGVSDLDRMLTEEKHSFGDHSGVVSFWESRIGIDEAKLDAVSPALHADQVKIPILLMHGKLDTTVRIAQSEAERDALQRAGKSVSLVVFDTDDHYLSLAATRNAMLSTLERFLHDHIGGP